MTNFIEMGVSQTGEVIRGVLHGLSDVTSDEVFLRCTMLQRDNQKGIDRTNDNDYELNKFNRPSLLEKRSVKPRSNVHNVWEDRLYMQFGSYSVK